MAGYTVTVQGANREIVSLTMSSLANYILAQSTLLIVTDLVQAIDGNGRLNVKDIAPGNTGLTGSLRGFGVLNSATAALGASDNVGALNSLFSEFVTNLSGTTTLSDDPAVIGSGPVGSSGSLTGFTLVSSTGDLVFTDSAVGSTIITGGGNNSVTLSALSSNTTFQGDGQNTILFNATGGAASVYGTSYGASGSSDSIYGSMAAAGLVYSSAAGAAALINPDAANVTIFGGSVGSETVFGGNQTVVGANGLGTTTVSGPESTGRLVVFAGEGYFKGAVSGGNALEAGAAGMATLVGGGAGDILRAGGTLDQLVAGPGPSTLDGSQSAGNLDLWAAQNGATSMFGSKNQGDNFFFNSSTVQGTNFTGAYASLHHAPDGTLLNNNAVNWVYVGHDNNGSNQNSANFGIVTDFIHGLDHLQIAGAPVSGSGQGRVSLNYDGQSTTLDTGAGSQIVFLNSHVTISDVGRYG